MIKTNELEAMNAVLSEDLAPMQLKETLLELKKLEVEQMQVPRTMVDRVSRKVTIVLSSALSRVSAFDARKTEEKTTPSVDEVELIRDVAAAKLQHIFYSRKKGRERKQAFKRLHQVN